MAGSGSSESQFRSKAAGATGHGGVVEVLPTALMATPAQTNASRRMSALKLEGFIFEEGGSREGSRLRNVAHMVEFLGGSERHAVKMPGNDKEGGSRKRNEARAGFVRAERWIGGFGDWADNMHDEGVGQVGDVRGGGTCVCGLNMVLMASGGSEVAGCVP
ncbi:hypothetical protein B0H19DRAFT_1083764 [Mycena capillaripes]|nr:hypothetical protein B0H19DRAFT_1083764 [Mycena capillaripes]